MTTPLPSLLVLAGALPDAGWLGVGLRSQAASVPAWQGFASRARLIEASIEPTGPVPEPGHLRFLARRHGLAGASAWSAFELAKALRSSPASPLWCVRPVHFLLGRDHIRLIDPGTLALDLPEAQALREAIAAVFEEEGLIIQVHTPGLWWIQAARPETALQIQTFSAAGAIGRSIDARLPSGAHTRRWKKLLNECQMIWHAHPVNEARQTKGQLPVNGLWIEGPSHDASRPASEAIHTPGEPPGGRTHGPQGETPDPSTLCVDTRLLDAQGTGDPQAWLHAWQEVCEAHLSGQAERFDQIVLAGDCGWRLIERQGRPGWTARISAWLASGRKSPGEQWLIPDVPNE